MVDPKKFIITIRTIGGLRPEPKFKIENPCTAYKSNLYARHSLSGLCRFFEHQNYFKKYLKFYNFFADSYINWDFRNLTTDQFSGYEALKKAMR